MNKYYGKDGELMGVAAVVDRLLYIAVAVIVCMVLEYLIRGNPIYGIGTGIVIGVVFVAGKELGTLLMRMREKNR